MTSRPRARRAAAVGGLAVALAASVLALPGTAVAAKKDPTPSAAAEPTRNGQVYSAGTYVVMFSDLPAASYRGGIAGYPATRPSDGQRMRPNRPEVVSYRSLLQSKHNRALKKIGLGSSAKIYDYSVAFNGMAVTLTAGQATALSKLPGVVGLFANEERDLTTNTTPDYLGLTAPGGLWSQLGGTGRNGAGAGTVVGVIDTGIWPENPQIRFANTPTKRIPGWAGICETGENFSQQQCNDKLVGARYFWKGAGTGNIAPADFKSPRDFDGHGTHTATTAAGSPAQAVVDGTSYGTVQGMAPAARIAAYKACWSLKSDPDGGCFTADTTAAIDAAVADGVDAINFSIGSGSESSILSSDEVAFLFAADAGVFVATSAGNEGPGASTTDHVSPWLTSTAAATTKINEKVAALGNGSRYIGASSTGTLPATPAVLAGQVAAPGVAAATAALCYPGSLDPAKVSGTVVVCDRGVIARVDKSRAVKAAGGAGMVLVNVSPNSLNADLHFVPTVHVNDTDGAAIKAYVGSATGPTIAIDALQSGDTSTTVVPSIAEFSSRGPSVGLSGDVIKPDIAAPGVDILAGVSPVTDSGRMWDLLSGTSMASPHIAGLGALLTQQHPDWSPAAIKSALQTSAIDTVGGTDSPFSQGAGFVQPNGSGAAELVYDSGMLDWLKFIKGQFPSIDLSGFGVTEGIDASDLNLATMAVGELAGAQTIHRTLTNVSDHSVTYRASVQGVGGVAVEVSPSSVTIPAGGSAHVMVTFTANADATLGEWTTGSVTWTKAGGGATVRSAVAVRPVAVSAPGEVHGTGTDGSLEVDVVSGFAGSLGTQVFGLAAGTVTAGSVGVDSAGFDADHPAAGPSVNAYPITVAADTTALRVDVDAASDASDLDLYLYDSTGALVALSATGAADEQVTFPGIPAGDYTAYVHGWGGPSPASYELTVFQVGSSDLGNLTVTPSPVTVDVAESVTLTYEWSGLDADTPYLGWVGYTRDGGSPLALTLVSIH